MKNMTKCTLVLLKANLLLLVVFLFGATTVSATTHSTVGAVIDGPSSVPIGQEITLEYQVWGGVGTCEINNGIGSFDVTTDPQIGSFQTVPPVSADPYTISCALVPTGGSNTVTVDDALIVAPNPTVTLTPRDGLTIVANYNGAAIARLQWESEYASECSLISSPDVNSPNDYIEYSSESNYEWINGERSRYKTFGRFFTTIYKDTTFFITCSNTATGAETEASVTIAVDGPLEPQTPLINVLRPVNETVDLIADPVRRYAGVRLEFRAENLEKCPVYKAYDYNDPTLEVELPEGFTPGNQHWLYRDLHLRLTSSVILEVTCTRPEILFEGNIFPAESVTMQRAFIVSQGSEPPPITYTGDLDEPPTVEVTVTPNPVERSILGYNYITANVTAANADRCNLKAYRMSDGVEFHLPNWTRGWFWSDENLNIDRSYTPSIEESVRLKATCVNLYQQNEGTTAQQESAVVTDSFEVTVLDPGDVGTAPSVWLYSGESVRMTASDIWNNNLSEVNMRTENNNGRTFLRVDQFTMENGTLVDGDGSIDFEFNHPHGNGESGVYNIHMVYCDESDGQSEFTFSSNRLGEFGSHTGNIMPIIGSGNCDSSTQIATLVEQNVQIYDGDIITISCEADQTVAGSGHIEVCRFSDIYFGAGANNRVLTVSQDPANPETSLFWMTDGATECRDMNAETESGITYSWSNTSASYGAVVDRPLEAETEYSITCARPIDGVETTETLEVVNSTSPDTPLDETVVVGDDFGYDFGSCYDASVDPPVLLLEAPDNNVVAPDGLENVSGSDFIIIEDQCVPQVDLSVGPVFVDDDFSGDNILSRSDGVDNVNGTYDLPITPYAQNLADIALPNNAHIGYSVSLQGGTVNESRTGFFNDALPANSTYGADTITEEQFDSIPFGTYTWAVRFNLDEDPLYPETDFDNNDDTDTVILPVPAPHMQLALTDTRPIINNAQAAPISPLVRGGSDVSLRWTVNVNYPMTCTLTGPAIGTQTLALTTVGSNGGGSNASTGIIPVVGGLQNTSDFEMSCTEPTTGQSFTYTGTIEVVPDFQEI